MKINLTRTIYFKKEGGMYSKRSELFSSLLGNLSFFTYFFMFNLLKEEKV